MQVVNVILLILFFVALGLLLWGMISPKSMSAAGKKPMTRKDAGIGFGIIAAVLFVLVGVTAPSPDSNNSLEKSSNNEITAVASEQDTQKDEQKNAPAITTKTVTEDEVIPFQFQTVQSDSLNKGDTKVTTAGVNGIKTRTYKVTYEDGKETKKELEKEEITRQPVAQITTVGTKVKVAALSPAPPKPAASCDPNYSGACVPIASDVDCEGGSGDGPAYVRGPVKVIGRDIYKLDHDKNGIGCE